MATDFAEGLASVTLPDGTPIDINARGNIVLRPRLKGALNFWAFSEGLALVTFSGVDGPLFSLRLPGQNRQAGDPPVRRGASGTVHEWPGLCFRHIRDGGKYLDERGRTIWRPAPRDHAGGCLRPRRRRNTPAEARRDHKRHAANGRPGPGECRQVRAAPDDAAVQLSAPADVSSE